MAVDCKTPTLSTYCNQPPHTRQSNATVLGGLYPPSVGEGEEKGDEIML